MTMNMKLALALVVAVCSNVAVATVAPTYAKPGVVSRVWTASKNAASTVKNTTLDYAWNDLTYAQRIAILAGTVTVAKFVYNAAQCGYNKYFANEDETEEVEYQVAG